VYVQQMFPLQVMIPASIAKCLAIYLGLQALAGARSLAVGWRAVAAAVTVFGFMLLMRVYDELKDVEADTRLGKAGDPRYKDRPIVTGAVLVEDVNALRWALVAMLVAINLPLGGWALVGFAVIFGVTWLSFQWFFWPAIKDDLLLAFATHNPIAVVLAFYVLTVFVGEAGWAAVDPLWATALLVGVWMPLAAWETARKIRVPEDETDYQTYSKIFGLKVAPLVPIGFTLIGATCIIAVTRAAGLSWTFPLILGGIALVPIGAALAFWLRPSRERAKLQPTAELFVLGTEAGLAAALIAAYGLRWVG